VSSIAVHGIVYAPYLSLGMVVPVVKLSKWRFDKPAPSPDIVRVVIVPVEILVVEILLTVKPSVLPFQSILLPVFKKSFSDDNAGPEGPASQMPTRPARQGAEVPV
jgi:hypothetical protein